MMETITSLAEVRDRVSKWRNHGERVALVPTMGNLHTGHLVLVDVASRQSDRCVVSIFVNPLQFGEGEDFDSYPRTLADDQARLRRKNVHLVYTPAVSDVYPRGQREQTRVEVPGISNILCGADRPGHFVGVATVVCKLLNMVQPDSAVFGEKDYQQLLVIRRLAEDLCFPVEITGVPTVREEDGLAMSSRNLYLSAEERRRAPHLYRELEKAAQGIRNGRKRDEIESIALTNLRSEGFEPDYFSIRRASDLAQPTEDDRELRILAAARLGSARLIDNLGITLP